MKQRFLGICACSCHDHDLLSCGGCLSVHAKQTQESINRLLERIAVPSRLFPRDHWRVSRVSPDGGSGYLIQLIFSGPDVEKPLGEPEEQHCRKWYVSCFATDTEVVRTAYKACEAALLHELDESFLLDDQRIFNPHRDIECLRQLAEKNPVDVRD
jgi:hypothetical protein